MSDLELEQFWPFLMGVISNKITNSASATYRRIFKVGITEWRVLSCLYAEGSLTAKDICTQVGQDKAAISRALQKLENHGYVVPATSKTNDGITSRKIPYRLTKTGTSLYKKMVKIAIVRQKILEDEFSPLEREQFTNYLHRVRRRVPALLQAMDEIEK